MRERECGEETRFDRPFQACLIIDPKITPAASHLLERGIVMDTLLIDPGTTMSLKDQPLTTIWETDLALNHAQVSGFDRSMSLANSFSYLRMKLAESHVPEELVSAIENDLAMLSAEGSDQLAGAIRSLSEVCDPQIPDYIEKLKAKREVLHRICSKEP